MTEAMISPHMLRWAYERSGESAESAAQKMGVSPETLRSWELDNAKPSFSKAFEFAHKFNVPLGYLYLSKPPDEDFPLPDLRTVAGAHPRKPSPEFLDVLYDALRKQDWYRDYLKEQNAEPLSFVGRFNGVAPNVIAADIRNTLGINQRFRQQANSWEQFLTAFVRRVEEIGVLVLRNSVVGNNTHRHLDVNEFRGFAMSDPFAPLIFINSADAKAAQIFTLAHELAHIWIGQSGISNPDFGQPSAGQRHETDRRCDAIAAEVLVPIADFFVAWEDNRILSANLDSLARRYRVSAFVVLRRAFELEKVDAGMYHAIYADLLAASLPKKGEGGGFFATFFARNSHTFTTAVVVAAAEGKVSQKEVAGLLGIKMATLPSVERRLNATGAS